MSETPALRALYVNCTIKKDVAASHTQRLIDHSAAIMKGAGVEVDHVHVLSHRVAFGMSPDMTKEGWDHDDWPELFERVLDADILVVGTPIWLGVKSSACTLFIERLYSTSSETNEKGQYVYYGKVGGCLVTGNEDGVKACSQEVTYALHHVGYAVPPQADSGWIGEAGPGASYGDEVDGADAPAGYDNEFTNRTTAFMAWNLIHLARLLKSAGGFPTHGNVQAEWDAGERFGHPLGPDGRPRS